MKRFRLTSVSNDRGFTLIEILIAITILSFMTMGVISITQNAADTMDRTTILNKNNLQIETALSRFEWDFSQIYSPLYFSSIMNLASADPNGNPNDRDGDGKDDNTGKPIPASAPLTPALQEYYQRLIQRFDQNQHFKSLSKEGLPVPIFYSPEKNIFEFFTSSNRRKMENTKQSHFGWVRYGLGEAIKRDDDDDIKDVTLPPGLKTFVRYYNADDPYGEERINPEDAEHVKAAVLLENVEALEFQFWNMNSRKWENNLKAIPGAENAVRGVRINITWYDSTGFKRTASRIYRNHWPMEVPQDAPTQTTPGTAGGTTGGGTTGGDDGGDSGDEGGANGGTDGNIT